MKKCSLSQNKRDHKRKRARVHPSEAGFSKLRRRLLPSTGTKRSAERKLQAGICQANDDSIAMLRSETLQTFH